MSVSAADKNLIRAVGQLLVMAQVRVTRQTLTRSLQQHPDFPSLAAVSDTLTELNVPNMATRLTADRLAEIPTPALAHLQIEGGLFAPIRHLTADRVEWLHTSKGWQMDSQDEFLHKWNGVTLLIEPGENAGEMNYAENHRKEQIAGLRIPFIVLGFCVCLGVVLAAIGNTLPAVLSGIFYELLLIKTLGVFVSAALVWYSIDTQNGFLQKVCQLDGRSDCQNILNTSEAKLTDWLSWAEIGTFYFAGGFLVTLVHGITADQSRFDSLPFVLLLMTCLSLPYTVWSVYYQAQVTRQWCLLCLAVQVLLWAEFIVEFGSLPGLNAAVLQNITSEVLSAFLVCFLLPVTLWTAIKPSLQKSLQTDALSREFQRLKFNPDYLRGLFSNQQPLPPIFDGMKIIRLGNPSADNTLVLVSNPTCAACRRTHLDIHKLLEASPDLHVQVILAASVATDDLAGKVARQILSLPTDQMADALHRWFSGSEGQFANWSRKTGGNHTNETAMQQQLLHLRWLDLAGVKSAPATFLNTAAVPMFYPVSELPKLCAFYSTYGIGQFT